MAKEFKLPNLGEGVDSGDVVEVHIKAGSSFAQGDTLIEVETNKAVMEVQAPADGVVAEVKVAAGDTLKPGDLIMLYEAGAADGSGSSQIASENTGQPSIGPSTGSGTAAEQGSLEPETGNLEPFKTLPPAAPMPAALAAPVDILKGSTLLPPPATPSTRRFARELGVNLVNVPGTGPGGRITQDDIQSLCEKRHDHTGSRSRNNRSSHCSTAHARFYKMGCRARRTGEGRAQGNCRSHGTQQCTGASGDAV